MLFYKISRTVKLASLELCHFGLAGQYRYRKLFVCLKEFCHLAIYHESVIFHSCVKNYTYYLSQAKKKVGA